MKIKTIFEKMDEHVIDDKKVNSIVALLLDSVKNVEKDFDHDIGNETVYHPKHLDNSKTFEKFGTQLVDPDEDFIGLVKNEKVVLIVGSYDPDYEDFFELTETPNEINIRRNVKDSDTMIFTFRGQTFIVNPGELAKALTDFFNRPIGKYDRIVSRKARDHRDYDDEYAPRRTRSYFPSNYWEDDEPDLDEDDFNMSEQQIFGSCIFKDLSHT